MGKTEIDDGFWSKEEFEDSVLKGILLQYEDRMHKESVKKGRKGSLGVSYKDFNYALSVLRQIGCYFAPNNREYYSGFGIQPEVDGIPRIGTTTHLLTELRDKSDRWEGEYAQVHIVKQVLPKKNQTRAMLPHGWFCDQSYKYVYRLFTYLPADDGMVVLQHYGTLSASGEPVPVYHNSIDYVNNMWGRRIKVYGIRDNLEIGLNDYSGTVSTTLFFWCDRVNMFNVVAEEEGAKVTFGVHETQIKSLFYARNLPLTVTGRKKPILHWVRAHQRRIKEGVDIDINKHLRGCCEFVMNDTKFCITLPHKQTKQ